MERSALGESVRRNGALKQKKASNRKYETYFAGYTEYTVVEKDARGKDRKKVVRVYTGDYHVQNIPDRKRMQVKMFYLAAVILYWVLFVTAGIQRLAGSRWYIELPQSIALFCLCWMSYTTAHCLFSKKKLTDYMFSRTNGWILRSARYLSVSSALMTLGMLAHAFVYRSAEAGRGFLYALAYLTCTVIAVAVYHTESNIPYLTVPGEQAPEIEDSYRVGEE